MNSRALLDFLARPRSGVPVALLFGGVASLARRVDTNWDLFNYHFYNPWAWLHGRIGFDYAPAQVQSYHSPLLDVPFYALAASGLPTFAVTFLMGLPFGLGAWFFYRLARDVVRDLALEPEGFVVGAALAVGLTGAAGFSQIGSTMNEWATTALVMAALFVLVRAACATSADGPPPRQPGRPKGAAAPENSSREFSSAFHTSAQPPGGKRREAALGGKHGSDGAVAAAALAGLLAGAATGLKLTAATHAFALGCALLVGFRGRPRCARAAVAFALAAALGVALAYGYWALVLWDRFGNPFFPYFNGVFRSEWWDPQSFFDAKFRPTSLAAWLAFPFRLVLRNRLASESDLRDPRLAALIALGAVLALSRLRGARKTNAAAATRRPLPRSLQLLVAFAATGYAAWLAVFAVYRYTIPVELVASLLLVLALRAVLAGVARRERWVAAGAAVIVAATLPPYWGRVRLSAGPYFDVAIPPISADSLVLLMTGEPFGYLVPFLDPAVRVISPASNFTGPWHDNRLQREMAALIAAQRGPIYAIRYLDATVDAEEITMAAYGLARSEAECRRIRSNREGRPLGLCRLSRIR